MLHHATATAPPRPRRRATSLLVTAGVMAGLLASSDSSATPAAFTFTPPNPGWVVALNGGMPLVDPEGDTPGPRDVVGDAATPMLYIASDATHIYFRLRLDDTSLQSPTNFAPFGWGCFINTDSDLTTYEFSTIVDGVNNPDQIHFFKNTMTASPNDPTEQPDMPSVESVDDPLDPTVVHAQVVSAPSMFGGTPDFFMEWAVELSSVLAAGFNPAIPASYYCGTSNSGTDLGADCSGSASGGCPLDGEFSDPIGCGPLGCAVCGDGSIAAGEGCDDGNLIDGDGCNAACLRELGQDCMDSTQCASGFCDPAGTVCACDEDADCAMGQTCNTATDPNTCEGVACGNNMVEAGEGCDDGNLMDGDGCNAVCLKEIEEPCGGDAECASSFCDPADSTCACDEDADCPAETICNTTLDPNECIPPGCGDGTVAAPEGCDDGNLMNGDGCNAQCLLELGEPCTSNDACDSGLCDPAGNICACDMDSDCPAGLVCDTEPDPNECVECTEDADCTGGEVCDTASNTCVPDGCMQDSDCPMGQVCDVPAGVCVPDDGCTQDSDCPMGQVCDEPSGECVECTQDSECPTGQVCDEAASQCVECTKDSECDDGEVCDEAAKVCVECTQDSDCEGGGICNADTNVCEIKGVAPQGNGIFCASQPGGAANDKLALAVLGLLGLTFLRRRRR